MAWYVLYCLIILEFITVKDSGTCVFCIKKEPCVLIKCSKAFSCAKAHCVWALSKPCCGFNVVLSLQRLSCVLNIEGHAIRHWLMHVSLPQMELILPMLIAFLRFVEWSWLGCCRKPITCWILVRLMFFYWIALLIFLHLFGVLNCLIAMSPQVNESLDTCRFTRMIDAKVSPNVQQAQSSPKE